MRVIYIADDGTQFDDEWECKSYEMRQNHPYCATIEYFNEAGNPLTIGEDITDAFDDRIYDFAWKVIIHNEEEFKDFCWLQDYHGWYDMECITGPGVWNYINSTPFAENKFVKEN